MEAAIGRRFRRFVHNDGDEDGAGQKGEGVEKFIHLKEEWKYSSQFDAHEYMAEPKLTIVYAQ